VKIEADADGDSMLEYPHDDMQKLTVNHANNGLIYLTVNYV